MYPQSLEQIHTLTDERINSEFMFDYIIFIGFNQTKGPNILHSTEDRDCNEDTDIDR